MPHRCWELSEIVGAIAANLVSDKATGSAVALARCCRSLEGPVLCKVWRTLYSLAPLVKCFPPEVWEIKDDKLFFKRAPFLMEWTRFQQHYASRVRHLVVTLHVVIPSATLQLLQLYSHSSPLLPNLLSIYWSSDDLPFLSSFISHSLTSIFINVSGSATRMLPPILMRLSTMSLDISKIVVQRLDDEPSIEEASSQLAMQCNPHRLRRYDVDAPLSTSAIRHLMQLPSLESLWLVGSFHFPDPLPMVVFPSLQELFVEFNKDLTWLEVLPCIQSPFLSMIYVECPGPEVAQFMGAFQLTMTECGRHGHLRRFSVQSQDDLKITPQIIACSLSFKNMTSLKFLSGCDTFCQTLDLTDDDIDLLTNAMPDLQYLAIGEQPCGVPSKVTFKSLYTISSRCTQLMTLQIHFDPNSFITGVNADSDSEDDVDLSKPEKPSSEFCSVTGINVGSIALPRESNVSYIMTSGLLRVFPCLEGVIYRDVAWKEIHDLIGVYRRIDRCISD